MLFQVRDYNRPALRQGKKKPQNLDRFLGFSFMAFRRGLGEQQADQDLVARLTVEATYTAKPAAVQYPMAAPYQGA